MSAPVLTEVVNVPLGMMRNIKAHAIENREFECCGMVGGDGGYATRLGRCGNHAMDPKVSFLIPAWHQFRCEQSFEKAGVRVIGIYHSHPSTAAEPSLADLAMVPSEMYSFIYSVPDDEVKCWRGATQVSIEVIR